MKLADRHTRAAQSVPNNQIYVHYERYINIALRAPGDFDDARESVGADAYEYAFTEDEREFYDQIYVASGKYPTGSADVWLKGHFGESFADHLRIGENEFDLLNFFETADRLLLLTAPVGWGKTVLLKYVTLYLTKQSSSLKTTLLPAYLNMDWYEYDLQAQQGKQALSNKITEVTQQALLKLVKPFTDVTNDQFWMYLRQCREFSDLDNEESDLQRIYCDPNSKGELSRRIRRARLRARRRVDFAFLAAKYVSTVGGKNIVLIYDNVDPLSMAVHEVGLQKAASYSEMYHLRVIVAMRQNTYDELAADHEGIIANYPAIRVRMKERDIAEYLHRRIRATLKEAKVARFDYIDYLGKHISQDNAERVLTAMCELLLKDPCIRALGFLSFHNLRKLHILLLKYFATGYIDSHKLVWSIVERNAARDSEYESPLWVLLASLLTCNHRTYFSKHHPDPRVAQCVVNVYCNHGFHINDLTIRLQVLAHLQRVEKCSFAALCAAYSALFRVPPVTLTRALCRCVRRLLDCNLVSSPERYWVASDDDVATLSVIEVTDTGAYYLEELSLYFEYIVFMKDDVDLPQNTKGIRSCIDAETREDRYREVYKFLELLFEDEDAFLRQLSVPRRRTLLGEFCPEHQEGPYFAEARVKAMITFGEKRGLPTDARENYHRLLERIRRATQECEQSLAEDKSPVAEARDEPDV